MKSIKRIFQVDRAWLAILPAWFNRQVSGAHSCLAHVVNAVEEMSFIILRLWYFTCSGQDGGEYLAHYILAIGDLDQLSPEEYRDLGTYHAV